MFPKYPLSLIAMVYSIGIRGKDKIEIGFNLNPFYEGTSEEDIEKLIKESVDVPVELTKLENDSFEYAYLLKRVEK